MRVGSSPFEAAPRPPAPDIFQALMTRAAEVDGELRKLTAENRELAEQCVSLQVENEALNNLYVASHRLHATLDPGGVMTAITEVLAELVGAEEFAILALDPRSGRLRRAACEGSEEQAPETLGAGDELFARLSAARQPLYFEPGSGNAPMPLAAVPLDVNGEMVAVILIHKLLRQKKGFSPIDLQLLQLLAAQAATALVAARLHSTTSRRLKTIEGFFHLVTGGAEPGPSAAPAAKARP